MALHSLLAFVSLFVNGGQDPSFDYQVALPVAQSAQGEAGAPLLVTDQDVRITTQFRDAKISEVLSWLEKRGLDFVVPSSAIPADARITMNVTNQPLEFVLDAIAEAFDGRWERRGSIRVFRKGAYRTSLFGFPTPPSSTAVELQIAPFQGTLPKELKLEVERLKGDPLRLEMAKEFGPDFLEKLKGLETSPLSKLEREKISDDVRAALESARRALAETSQVAIVPPAKSSPFRAIDVPKLLASLTSKQRATQKSRGFLRWGELSKVQQAMLGKQPKGTFEMRFKSDKSELVIKN